MFSNWAQQQSPISTTDEKTWYEYCTGHEMVKISRMALTDFRNQSIALRCWTIAHWRHNRLMALYRLALTITLRFTTSDAERTSWIMNCAHVLVLVDAICRLLRDGSMVAQTTDRPTV